MGEQDKYVLANNLKNNHSSLWLHNIARGIDTEPVTPKFTSKSIGCCKKFPGRNSIKGLASLQHWLSELAQEIFERIAQDEAENNRRPRQMVVSFVQDVNRTEVSSTRSVPLTLVDAPQMATYALDVIRKNTAQFLRPSQPMVLNDAILFLGITVTKFEDLDKAGGGETNTIMSMFSRQTKQLAEAAKEAEAEEEKTENLTTDPDESINGPQKRRSGGNKSIVTMFGDKARRNEELANENRVQQDQKQPIPQPVQARTSFFGVKRKTPEPETVVENEIFRKGQGSSPQPPDDQAYLDDTLEEDEPESMPQPSTSTSSNDNKTTEDYRSTYAEFQLPAPSTAPVANSIPTERCAQCNRKVPVHEMQSHTDAHFAFQLSQEQRIEFRTNLAKSIVGRQSQPSAKKPKLNHSGVTASPPPRSTLLHQFLVKTEPKANEMDAEDDDLVAHELCGVCGRQIRVDRLLEHSDYHAAKRLQAELNGMPVASRVNSLPSTGKKSTKTVAAFFKKGAT